MSDNDKRALEVQEFGAKVMRLAVEYKLNAIEVGGILSLLIGLNTIAFEEQMRKGGE